MARTVLLVDGRIVSDGMLRLDPDDPGLCWGMTVFETVRVHRGRACRLDAHLARLARSAAHLGLERPSDHAVLAACWAAQSALDGEESVLRITVTGGGRWMVRGRPAPPRRTAATCITRPHVDDPHVPAAAKHGNRIRGRQALRGTGADEVIWVRPGRRVVEGSWSNVLAVVEGVLRTPPADGGLLPGTVRAAILQLARSAGTPTEETELCLDAPLSELYLSSAVHGLVPVVSVDGHPGPGGGPVGAKLDTLLWARSPG